MELSEYETIQLQNELNRRGYWVIRQGLHSYSEQELKAELSRRQYSLAIETSGGQARDLNRQIARRLEQQTGPGKNSPPAG